MGIQDALGNQQPQQNELLRQLGYITSYSQPNFSAGRGSDGPFDGLGSAIADLVGGKSREETAIGDMQRAITARSQRVANAPAVPGANSPRPKDVVKGFASEGFNAKTIADALKAIQSAPYELGVRQGNPQAREIYDEQVRAGTMDLLGDDQPTDAMFDVAARNPRAAALLDEAYGSGRQEIAQQRNAGIQRQANVATDAWAQITDPYASAAGAVVALQEDDLGKELVAQPQTQRMLHNDNVRGAALDLNPLVKQFGLEKLDDLIDGEEREAVAYGDGDPEKPMESPSYGRFGDLFLNPGSSKIKGKGWTLGVQSTAAERSKEALHADVDGMVNKYVENALDGSEAADVKQALRAYIDEEVTGVRAGGKATSDPKLRQLASEIVGTVLTKYGSELYLTNTDENGQRSHYIGPDLDFSPLLSRRTIRTGEFQGRPTVAEQYGLSEGQREALKQRYRAATEKLVGPMEGFLKQKWTADLKKKKVDDAAIENLVESALQETRPKLLLPGVKKAFERDPEGFYQKRVQSNFERWLTEEQGITDKSKLTPAAAGFVRANEAMESSDALQQMIADPLGGMDQGMGQDDELMQMLEQGRQQPRYGAQQAPPDVAPPGMMPPENIRPATPEFDRQMRSMRQRR